MKNILGPIIGAAVDRRDGDSGIKGALVGSLVQSAARATVSIVATLAAGWVVKKLFNKATRSSGAGEPSDSPPAG